MNGVSDREAIEQLRTELDRQSTDLIFLPETESTMDIDVAPGIQKAVVLTDHQTKGRGRYERDWHDTPGKSILATFVRVRQRAGLPSKGSLLLSHCFVLAVKSALGSADVKIKWPNDLMLHGRKLGGVLLTETPLGDDHVVLRFGVGVNLVASGTSDQSASLDEVTADPNRNDLIMTINRMLDFFLGDVSRLDDEAVRTHYEALWREASWLVGKQIRITAAGSDPIEGTVRVSPYGGHLQLSLSKGGIMELKEYGHTAHIEVLNS